MHLISKVVSAGKPAIHDGHANDCCDDPGPATMNLPMLFKFEIHLSALVVSVNCVAVEATL